MAVLELEVQEVVNRDAEIPETVNIPNRDAELPAGPAHPALLEMADLIARRGWCQGTYNDGDGRLCILGAYNALMDRNGTWMHDDEWEFPYMRALAAFEAAIAPEMGAYDDECWDAAHWNDQPERSQLEVIDRLRRVGWLGR